MVESAFPRALPMSTVDAGRLVRFGTFELDLDAGVLHRHGRRVPLQEQPARILILLASRPGEVVTREELRQLLWTDNTFVEFDASLNAAITKIRRALRDSASAPRFIETVPKRGYRFSPTCRDSSLGRINGRRRAGSRRCSFSAVGYRSSTGAAGPSSTQDRVTGNRGRDPLSAWLLSPGLALRPRAPLVRSLTVQPFEMQAEEMHPNLGSELAAAIGRRLGRLQSLTVKPWPPGGTANPRALSRELGVDARLSGVATRRGQQLAIALRMVSTDGERALWKCRRCARRRSDVAGIADRPAGRHGARRSDERERARGARPPHDGEPRGVSVVPAGTVALRTADEPRSARRDRGVRAGHGQRLELRARLRVAREHLHAAQLPRIGPAVGNGTGSTRGWRKGAPARRWSGRGAPQSCVGHGLSRATLGTGRGGVSPRTRARSQLRHRSPLVFVLPHDPRTIRRGAGRATTCARNRSADADAERGARGPAHRHAPARSCS